MEKPTKRTVGIMRGHSLKTTPMEFYHPAEVDAYIAHLEQRAEAELQAVTESRDQWKANAHEFSRCADRLEAKLAELEKQEPAGYAVKRFDNGKFGSWLKSKGLAKGDDDYYVVPLFERPAPAVSLAELVPTVCDGKEQEAFEEYARSKGLDLSQHPLHYLFLDGKTNQARSAWRECLVYVRAAILRNIEEAK